MLQYFEQRILNKDSRFARSPDYVFAAFAAVERQRLDSNVGISFKRGQRQSDGTYTLNYPYSVLDNTPGTPRYWQKKKYKLIARLENLGAFQLFFTLSCADMRWNENFTTPETLHSVFSSTNTSHSHVKRGELTAGLVHLGFPV